MNKKLLTAAGLLLLALRPGGGVDALEAVVSVARCPPYAASCQNTHSTTAAVGDECSVCCATSEHSNGARVRWCPTTGDDLSGGDGTAWGWCAERGPSRAECEAAAKADAGAELEAKAVAVGRWWFVSVAVARSTVGVSSGTTDK